MQKPLKTLTDILVNNMLLQIETLLPFLGGKLDFSQLIVLLVIVWLGRQLPSWLKEWREIQASKQAQKETLLQLSKNVNAGTELIAKHLSQISHEIEDMKRDILKETAIHKEEILEKLDKLQKNMRLLFEGK
jgi:hypothetical protein